MTYKLLCGQDPAALGIETAAGWDMPKFKQHLQNCPACRKAARKLTAEFGQHLRGMWAYVCQRPFGQN